MTAGAFRPTSPPRSAPADPAEARAAAAEVVEANLNGVMWRDVVVPRTQVAGKMRLLRRAEETAVRMAVRRELAERFGIRDGGPGAIEGYPEWREAWRLHFISIAVRNPLDPSQPLFSVEHWADTYDDVQLLALWTRYQDFEAELDPFGPNAPQLTEEEAGAIRAAAKKGEGDLLMSYGSRRLAAFAISTVAAPAT